MRSSERSVSSPLAVGTSADALVRSLREHLGLTQEQLAHKLGVSFSTVNVWENGKREPLPFLYRRLIEIAGEAGLELHTEEQPRPRRIARRKR